ncbi:MAG TPA: porin [Anaeromyxobacter sp.]|nr:porin [Anaeromyxobacter sp.]
MKTTMVRSALALVLAMPLAAAAQAAANTSAPAAAPEGFKLPFTIYGTLNLNFQDSKMQGAANPALNVNPRTLVSTDSSNIGIRGTFDVAGGLQVVYQCETSAAINGVSVSGICNRNSRVGLGSPVYGTLFYGNWDTPYKATTFGTKADDPFYATDVWDFESILTSPGFNTKTSGWVTGSATPVTSFAVRLNNTVAYHSPKWSGVSFRLAYGASYFKNATGTQNPYLYSACANYDNGPISVGAGWEQHHDGFALVAANPAAALAFGATAANTAGAANVPMHSSDSAWHVAAGYELGWAAGATTLGGMYEQIMLDQSDTPTGSVKSYNRAAWQLTLKHRVGSHELRGRYSMADQGSADLVGGAASTTSGYGASGYAVGYGYFLAPTAQVYLHYTIIQNAHRAQYTFGTAGSPTIAGATPAGADPQAIGLGIRYSF